MPIEHDRITESLVFDGAIALRSAVVLGMVLLILTSWLLLRDRRVLGTAWTAVFWVLRVAALGVALWMAVGPVRERIERTSIPQSIALIVDRSESMDVVDPPDGIQELRWQLAARATGSDPSQVDQALIAGDQASVAIAVAVHHCRTTQRLLVEHQPLNQLRTSLAATRVTVDRVLVHCQSIEKLLTDTRDDIVEGTARVESLLEGPVKNSLDRVEKSMTGHEDAVVSELTTSLAELGETLSGAQRRVNSLAADMVDERSQLPADRYAGNDVPSRRQQTTSALEALEAGALAELPADVRVNRFGFDSELTALPEKNAWQVTQEFSEGPTSMKRPKVTSVTDLSAVLRQLAQDRNQLSTRLALIYSDGRHNAPESVSPQEMAGKLADLPVFIVPVGNEALVRDLIVHRAEAPATIVEHDSAVIEAIVTAFDSDGQQSELVLRHDGKVIDSRRLEFTGERIDRRVQFDVPAEELGWQEYELSLEPIADEASQANNVAPIQWEVVKDKIRVLLSDGVSQWEYRYLQQLFRRDPHIECDELLFFPRLRGTGNLATKLRFPETPEDWALYDVVILGDVSPRFLSRKSQEALVEYVERRDGHLILIAGRDNMPQAYEDQPLMRLLPVEPLQGPLYDSYTVSLTDEGRLHSALAIEEGLGSSEEAWLEIYDAKPLTGLSSYCKPKETARTLLDAIPYGAPNAIEISQDSEPDASFLCWQQVGAGRVVYLSTPQTWKLRYQRGDRRHHRFWGQLIRWITATNLGSGFDLVRLSTDKNRYNPREPVEVTVWLKDQSGRPLDGQEIQIAARVLDKTIASGPLVPDEHIPGRYAGKLTGLAVGTYEIVAEGAAIDQLLTGQSVQTSIRSLVSVQTSNNLEMMDTRCDRALLEQVAEITGGKLVPPTAVAEVLALASLSPEMHENVERFPLWNRWKNLWLILGCLFTEWIVRKAKGLV